MRHCLTLFLALGLITWGLPASTQPLSRAELKEQHRLALQVLDALQPRSIAENREYCGVIRRAPGGKLFIGAISAGEEATCAYSSDQETSLVVASFHTHGPHSPSYDAEVPSITDLESDFALGSYGYVATPAGRVWLIDPFAQHATLLCGRGCVTADPTYRPADTGRLLSRYTLRSLAKRFGL